MIKSRSVCERATAAWRLIYIARVCGCVCKLYAKSVGRAKRAYAHLWGYHFTATEPARERAKIIVNGFLVVCARVDYLCGRREDSVIYTMQ